MDVKALQWELAAFVAERGLESRHSPKSLAMALVGEGGTLLDLFKWLSDEESRQVGRQEREAAAEAIAEIFLHALRLADELGIDVEDAVAKKSTKLGGKAPERRPEAPQAAPPPPPPPPAPSAERQLKSASRPVPLAGPPSVRPASRSAAPPPEFPRVRQPPAAPPPDFPRVRQPAPPARAATIPPSSRAAAPPPAPRPAPAARPAPPPPPPEPPPPEVEPYAELDLEAVGEFVKSLSKRIDAAQSDHPLVRELRDELETLRRTLYSKTFKRSWIGTSLENVRMKLLDAAREPIGEALKARQHIAEIDRLLDD